MDVLNALVRNWWLVALRGLAALAFGILTLVYPALSLTLLVLLFGAYAFVDGVFIIFSAIARRGERHWVALLVSGILAVGIGVLTFVMPQVTALALVLLMAAWAVVTGLGQIVAGVRLRKLITGEWLLILAGVLSVIFGAMLAVFPGAGALAVALWIGLYAAVLGILLIALAFKLRSRAKAPAA